MKVIVAHPAQQHSYRLATALKNANMLEKYATTVYNKKGSLTALCAHLLRGKFRVKAESRHCDNLDDNDVIQFCELEGLIKLVALNTNFLKRHYYQIKYHTADCFARKVARYAIKHHVDAVITYDDSSPLLFEILEREAPHILRIMDMSSANLLYLKNIYEHDMELAPSFAERMRRERSICWDQDVLDRAEREIKATQKFLVPSEFVSRSLAYSGVKSEQLLRCPYGVDIAQFSPKEYKDDLYIKNRAMPYRQRPLHFIYVGGVKELKGISYLLEAFREIPVELADLTVVGNYCENDTDTRPYQGIVKFTGSILHSYVAEELKKADVFVFASLGEGLSLSTLEAAACGLPLIVTENSGVNDEMTDGVEGFVIPIQSKKAIQDKVYWFIEHPEMIHRMGEAAKLFAQKYTWEAYYKKVKEIFENEICSD